MRLYHTMHTDHKVRVTDVTMFNLGRLDTALLSGSLNKTAPCFNKRIAASMIFSDRFLLWYTGQAAM